MRVSLLSLSAFALACASSCASTPSADSPAGAAAAGTDDSKRSAARAQLDELTTAASRFTFAVGRCPQGIEELVHPPTGGEAFLPATPVDPWGNGIAFMPASEDNSASQFVSAGPDGALLTDDDISARAPCTEP